MECIQNDTPCCDPECENAQCLAAQRSERLHICEDVECEEPQCVAHRAELRFLVGDPWLNR